MNNWKHYISYGIGLISLIAISAAVSACSLPSSTPSSAAAIPSAPQPTATAPNQPDTGTPSSTAANRPQGRGASGTITGITGNTLTLNTSQGQVTVNLSSNIPVQETVTGAISDLQVGQFLTVIGSPDASGNITASTIMLRPQSNQFTPPAGSSMTQGNRPPGGTGGGQRPGFPNSSGGRGTMGTLASINGNTLALTTNQGQVTININSNTVIEKTVTGSVSDLKEGQSITVIGTTDSSNNLTASTIIVRPQNSQSSPPSGT